MGTYCACLFIVYIFPPILHMLDKARWSDVVGRPWICVEEWSPLRFWPRLMFPAFFVWAQQKEIIVSWRSRKIWLRTEISGAGVVWSACGTHLPWGNIENKKVMTKCVRWKQKLVGLSLLLFLLPLVVYFLYISIYVAALATYLVYYMHVYMDV